MSQTRRALEEAGKSARISKREAKKAIGKLGEAGEAAIREARGWAEEEAQEVERAVSGAGQMLRERAEERARVLQERYDRTRKSLLSLAGDVRTYARDNPGRCLVAAAAIGFFAGLVVANDQRAPVPRDVES